MSYRAFKRLLGETSLERKCRFLLGGGIIVLITASFWLYANQTESLAYNQATTTCRLLVYPIIAKAHLAPLNLQSSEQWNELMRALKKKGPEAQKLVTQFLAEFRSRRQADFRRNLEAAEHRWLVRLDNQPVGYASEIFRRKDFDDPEEKKKLFDHPDEEKLLEDFFRAADPPPEAISTRTGERGERNLYYYGAVRPDRSCIACHQHLFEPGQRARPAENDLMAVVRIRMPTSAIETGVHVNRAVLISTALVTALLIMGGTYIVIRYVIVKPVKHLKEVSDAISAGELNVRSEIQTGDEFEDLSHAFNRMLRNLVSMQDRWRKVNADLDRKVDELAQANMALYESNRLKGDFMATMSHELRTPLNSILGFSEVLLSGNGLSDKQLRWVHNIQSSGERLLNLINDILDLAKIEAGKMQVHLEEFSIPEVAEGLINMFRPLAEKKNIDLRSQIDPTIAVLRQDMVKLQQILSNLLSNAIKFTPEGGRVLLKAEADPLYITLAVSDTGVGIAQEEQDLVFEKFRQSGNPLTREHAGTGLGLSIVRELAKLLGGDVSLHSELGRGSTFTVRLPLQLSEEPRLEFDLAREHVDLAKAQRVDLRQYAAGTPAALLSPDPAAADDGKDFTI
jgi:signal transduction histidine kinase